MTETENREVLEQRMARAIKEAAKDIVSPPRSCPDCAAIGNSSRFGTDKSHGESLVVHIDRENDCMTLACYQNGELFWSGVSGTTAETVTRVAAYLLDLEPPSRLKPRERRDDDIASSGFAFKPLAAETPAHAAAAPTEIKAESPEVPQRPKKAELEPEEIRERLDVAVTYASNFGATLQEAAEDVNKALAILRQGGSDYS